MTKRVCTECSREFDLSPKKPGRANRCPACSPPTALLPQEAREARITRNNEIYEPLFREAIDRKRKAEALGQIEVANKLEKEIVALGKMRIKP